MPTVRELKTQVRREAGCTESSSNFPDLSDVHRAFWRKLNRLGARGLDVPDSDKDIDAKAQLSDTEYTELLREFRSFKINPA